METSWIELALREREREGAWLDYVWSVSFISGLIVGCGYISTEGSTSPTLCLEQTPLNGVAYSYLQSIVCAGTNVRAVCFVQVGCAVRLGEGAPDQHMCIRP